MAKGDKKPVVMGDGIVNDLTTGGANAVLSAEMGKVLANRTAADWGAAKVHKLRATLASPGWYRIGKFERTENIYLASGAVRLVIGGAYSYNAPTDCIVDAIVSNGINSVDLVKVAGKCSPAQISKVRICYADEAFYLDVYFQVNTTEVVYINVHELMQGFTPHSFTNVTNSTEAVKVELDLNEWENPPMELGVEYRTTERYMGKPVYVKSFRVGRIEAGDNQITHNIASIAQPMSVRVFARNTSTEAREDITQFSGITSLTFDGTNVNFSCNTAFGDIYLLLKYTKA